MQAADYPYKWWALIGLSLLSFTAFLDFTIVTTALPFIQKDLNATVLQLQWVMTIFGMILCMFMIAAGRIGDLFGRKRIYYCGFILFLIAAIGAGYSPTIHWLTFFRAAQGFAAAIIFTLGVALLPQAFPASEQTRAISFFSAFNGAGLAMGPFLGGLLITLLSWRWVFWINIPIILVGMLCCSFSLKSPPPLTYKVKLDWLGLLLLIISLGTLIYGVVYGEQAGWSLTLPWLLIIIGFIALSLLIIIERKAEQPLLELSLFKNAHASLAILVCVTAGLVTYVFMFFDPLYLQLMRKQGAFIVGLTLLCVPIIQVIISLFLSPLLKKYGIINLLVYGLAAALLAALLHVFFTLTISIFFVMIALALMGYTWGIANAGSITALAQTLPPEKMGAAIGTVFTFWNISGSVFLALATVVFHWREAIAINSALNNAKVALTPDQHQQISLLLYDPEHAHSILSQFVGTKSSEIYHAFHVSFMSGFHWVALLATMVMLIIFLIGLALRRWGNI